MKKFICLLLAAILSFYALTAPVDAAVGSDTISVTTGWYWPLSATNKTITRGFGVKQDDGALHQGLDIGAATGTNIYAARTGVVYMAGTHNSMGNYVCIRHGLNNGKYIFTTYMHMTKRTVNVGAAVDQNTVIGYVGSTGKSSGPHLHFHIFTSTSKNPTGVSPTHNNSTELNNSYINPSSIQYSYTRDTPAQNTNTPEDSTLKINMTSYPGTLQRGSSYGLRGSISSNYDIIQVSGSVINSSGKTVLTSSDKPNDTSMNVQNANLNKKLTFDTLAAGTYTLKVDATDASGKTKTWSTSFSVRTNLSVNMTSSPTSIKYGNSFGLRGTIKSDEKITSVVGIVLNSSGKAVLSSIDKPNAKSMDVRTANLNNKITFNKLSKGDYTLKIVATDASGNTVTWSKSFKVY